ncbi:hypothetical protein GCM10027405_26270 [Arthrobacter alkaliphilus]
MKYYRVEPAVDGSLGEMAEFVRGSENRMLVTFHMVLHDWLGDDLVTTTPGFAVTRALADRLQKSGLTGFDLKDMHLSISPQGTELMRFGDAEVPDLVWLDPVGRFGEGDFFMDRDVPDLIVSEKALRVLQEFDLKRARVGEF